MYKESMAPLTRRDLKPETLKVIQKVLDRIPQLPVSVQKVIDMTMDDDIGAKELAEVALTDPVLSSKILTQVNSAYYGFNRRIEDMRVAIVLIGFNAVRNIAIQNRFQQVFSLASMNGLYERDSLWMHSYLVSVCAETFADEEDIKRHGVLATMGILHDIGKYALINIGMMMEKKGILKKLGAEHEGCPLLLCEDYLYGVNHAIVGAMLATKWNLSERICAVLEYHHFPSFFAADQVPERYLADIALVCLADMVVNCYLDVNVTYPVPPPVYFEVAGLEPPIGSLLTPDRRETLDKAKHFLEALLEED